MVFCMYQIISRYIGYARERRHNSEINNSVIEENTSTPDLSTDKYKNINPGLAIDLINFYKSMMHVPDGFRFRQSA